MVTKVAVPPSTVFRRRPQWISTTTTTPFSPQVQARHNHFPSYGIITPAPNPNTVSSKFPFFLETGYALCAKRPPRPFPPPFLTVPTTSFSDPLTSPQGLDKRLSVKGEPIRGLSNGDDAVLVGENFMGVNDGVGAWATKPHGHAG